MLRRVEQLEFCKICQNRQMDMQKGIICQLTGDVADFENTCPSFLKDEVEAAYQTEQKSSKAQEEAPIEIINRLDEPTIVRLREAQDLSFAILGGLASALFAAVFWAAITVATNYQIGIMAIAVGLLVGLGVRFFGAGIDKTFGVIGACYALLGCLLGNLFSQVWFMADYNSMGIISTFKLLNAELLVAIYKESFNPIDLIFYGIAIAEGYKFAFRKISERELLNLKNSPNLIPYPPHHKLRTPLVVIVFLLLSALFFGMRGDVNGEQTFYYENGMKMSEGNLKDGVVDGLWTYYNENGSVMLKGNYSSGLENGRWEWYEGEIKVKEGHYLNGVPNGVWVSYHLNGQAADSASYKNGRMSGKWLQWHKNGELATEGEFLRDLPHGEWRAYNKNGQLISVLNYINGKLHGESTRWYNNGQISQELVYTNDQIEIINCWDKNGKQTVSDGNGRFEMYNLSGTVIQAGHVKNRIQSGLWQWFYDSGVLRMEGEFDKNGQLVIKKYWDDGGNLQIENGNGLIPNSYLENGNYESGHVNQGYRNGLWHLYASSGELLTESTYDKGDLEGPFIGYYASGVLSVEGNYDQNTEEGEWNWYYENGQLKSSVNYVHGKKHGVQNFYNELGIKVREEIYENGKLLEEKLVSSQD